MLHSQAFTWDRELIDRYDLSGPRYTSYPTAPQFHGQFNEADLHAAIDRSNAANRPLSLYCHIPFCSTVCYYCACNKIVTANRKRAQPYLQRMQAEIARMSDFFDGSRPVKQLHWGGGTPTYINDAEKRELMATLRRYFNLYEDDCGEYSIEVHPGDMDVSTIDCLRDLGFNRLSMGVQDFDDNVQQAVNRFNSSDEVRALTERARQLGFRSISMDLIYGLPQQTWDTFAATLAEIIALSPDRLSVFNYAHMPHLFKVQKQIDESALPSPAQKLEMMERMTQTLLAAGYLYIGMDHFAKPDDELAIAQRSGKLQRNFQGYSTHGDCDLLAFGVSAISAIDDIYMQNHRQIDDYQVALDSKKIPMARGIALTAEDRLRQEVIKQLTCHFSLDFVDIESRFAIDFQAHFANELRQLSDMARDGVVDLGADRLSVTASGRILLRRVCMVFDSYIQQTNTQGQFSRII